MPEFLSLAQHHIIRERLITPSFSQGKETEDSITDEKFRLLMGLPQELNMPGAACLNQSTDKKRNQVGVTENKGLDEDPIIHHYSSPGSKQEECPPLSFSLRKNMHPTFHFSAGCLRDLFLSHPTHGTEQT